MPRNTNKTPPPVELVNATYDDVINKFIKKFDLPPQIAATIIIALRDRYSQMAIHLALDSA